MVKVGFKLSFKPAPNAGAAVLAWARRSGMSAELRLLPRLNRRPRNLPFRRKAGEVNERMKDVKDSSYLLTTLREWACACANKECVERLEMSAREYEHVRQHGARFFVFSDDKHVWPDVERVVERLAHYWVVEKIELGAARRSPHSRTLGRTGR